MIIWLVDFIQYAFDLQCEILTIVLFLCPARSLTNLLAKENLVNRICHYSWQYQDFFLGSLFMINVQHTIVSTKHADFFYLQMLILRNRKTKGLLVLNHLSKTRNPPELKFCYLWLLLSNSTNCWLDYENNCFTILNIINESFWYLFKSKNSSHCQFVNTLIP